MNISKYLNIINGPYELPQSSDKGKLENSVIDFSFEPDHFQKHSFKCITNNENILVTAHTGSGKTAIAEYAIVYFNKLGKKVIYTSPIKALSNQKYKEFRDKFEDKYEISVGIMTGDNKINPNADCVIMTTEILRNALYDIGESGKTKKEEYFDKKLYK